MLLDKAPNPRRTLLIIVLRLRSLYRIVIKEWSNMVWDLTIIHLSHHLLEYCHGVGLSLGQLSLSNQAKRH